MVICLFYKYILFIVDRRFTDSKLEIDYYMLRMINYELSEYKY